MISDAAYFSMFKRLALASEHLTLEEKYGIFQSLYEEARELGNFRRHDLLLGLDDAVRLAAALNANVSSPPR